MSYDLIVRGGRVWVDGALVEGDVAIDGERIAAIGEDLGPASHVVDASGQFVLPGAIDAHTHFDTRLDGAATADDYESGTRAAAFGGLTTIVNYAFQGAGERLCDVLDRELAKAEGRSYVDYGFHVVITDASGPHLGDELTELVQRGVSSVKVFTAMDFRLTDDQLLDLLSEASGKGILVNVHAEDGPLVDHLTRRLLAGGQADIGQLGPSRPPRTEALAVEKMVTYAGAAQCPVYIVHLSTGAALDAVRRGRREGIEVYVETRPAYLFLDADVYTLPDAPQYACWPPIRGARDRDALWRGLADGDIQTYATDHTTWTRAQKLAAGLDFSSVPGGMSNVQTSIGMLFSEGVQGNRLTLARFVQVVAEMPAKLFGLWPRKGSIAVGADADLMLIDPELRYRIGSEPMQSASDFEPYDGYTSQGWPTTTISRGRVVIEDQRLTGAPGHGRFVRRDPVRGVSEVLRAGR